MVTVATLRPGGAAVEDWRDVIFSHTHMTEAGNRGTTNGKSGHLLSLLARAAIANAAGSC